MGHYLSAESARARLIREGVYTEAVAPSIDELDELLDVLEAELEGWLRWKPALTQYTKSLEADENGVIRIPYKAVKSVESVESVELTTPGQTSRLAPTVTFYLQQSGVLKTSVRNRLVQVSFTAGLDPLPDIFSKRMYQLVKTLLETSPSAISGDISALFTFIEQPKVASISLPGGLSKTFANPSSSSASGSSGDGPANVFEKVVWPLRQYRKQYTL